MVGTTISTMALSSRLRDAAHRTSRAARIRVRVRTAKRSMCACATRGFSRAEICQAAGRGVDAGREAGASKMKRTRPAFNTDAASQRKNGTFGKRREEAAACQGQLHTAASCWRGDGSPVRHRLSMRKQAARTKKYASCGIE